MLRFSSSRGLIIAASAVLGRVYRPLLPRSLDRVYELQARAFPGSTERGKALPDDVQERVWQYVPRGAEMHLRTLNRPTKAFADRVKKLPWKVFESRDELEAALAPWQSYKVPGTYRIQKRLHPIAVNATLHAENVSHPEPHDVERLF